MNREKSDEREVVEIVIVTSISATLLRVASCVVSQPRLRILEFFGRDS